MKTARETTQLSCSRTDLRHHRQVKGSGEFGRCGGDVPLIRHVAAAERNQGKILEEGEGTNQTENFWGWDGGVNQAEGLEGGR